MNIIYKIFLVIIIFLLPYFVNAQSTGTPIISIFAGNDTARYSGDGSQATSAAFNNPTAITKDFNGNYYIADKGNHVVRKIKQSGIISTFAGTGSYGYTGAATTATSTPLKSPVAVCADAFGNIYIADSGVVRKVDISGQISTFAGGSGNTNNILANTFAIINPQGLAVDNSANIYIADDSTHQIYYVDNFLHQIHFVAGAYNTPGYTGNGGMATNALIYNPKGIAIDVNNNIYFSDSDIINHKAIVRKINASGIITTIISTGLNNPWGIGVDNNSNLYISNAGNSTIVQATPSSSGGYNAPVVIAGTGISGYTGINGIDARSAQINTPMGIYVDPSSKIFFADTGNRLIRKVIKNNIPQFTHVNGISVNVCQGSTGNLLDSLFTIVDFDTSQTENWTITGPAHGVISGLSTGGISNLSNGDTLKIASGSHIFYTPNTSYASDFLTINVSDGFNNNTIVVNINALSIPSVSQINIDGGDTTLCIGTIRNVSETTVGGNWYSTHLAVATVGLNGYNFGGVTYGKVYAVSAGIDTIIYTVNNNCFLASATKIIQVFGDVPTIHAIKNGSSVIGLGCQTTFITVDSGGTWSHSSASIATINPYGHDSSELLVYGNNVGTDIISYSISNACGTSISDTVIHVESTQAGTIIGLSNVCANAKISLFDSVSSGYWSLVYPSDTTFAKVDSLTGLVSGIQAGSVGIRYTTNNNCSGFLSENVTKLITINPVPAILPIIGDTVMCNGSAKTYTDATLYGYWSINNSTLASVNASTGIVSGLNIGTTTLSYNVSNGTCTAVNTLPVHINPLANAGVITNLNTLICKNAVIPLTNTVSGGLWSVGDTTNAFIRSGDTLVGKNPGSVTIYYTVFNGCSSASVSQNISIQNLLLPVVTPSLFDPLYIRENCSASYPSPSPSGGTWSLNNTSLVNLPSPGFIITGSNPGFDTISYTVTNACGITKALGYIQITPTISSGTIVGDTSVCVNSILTLTDSVPGGTWSLSNASKATISALGIVTGLAAGTDTVSYTNTLTCGTSTAIKVIKVNKKPYLSHINGHSLVCSGTTDTLTDSVAGGTWAVTNNNSTLSSISSASGLLLGASQGHFTIIYTIDSFSCYASDTFRITFDSGKLSPGLIFGDSVACLGTPFYLHESLRNGIWDTSSHLYNHYIHVNDTALSAFCTHSGLDTFIYKVTNGCGDSMATKTITVFPAITRVSHPIIGRNAVCIGTTTQLIDSILLIDSFYTPQWQSSNHALATINTFGIITGVAAGIDTITLLVSNSCGSTDTAQKIITVLPVPNTGKILGDSIICVNNPPTNSIQLTDTISGGVWNTSNANGFVTSTGKFYPQMLGTVTVYYSISNACDTAVTTKTLTIQPAPPNGIIKGNNISCIGSHITFTDTVTGGNWSVTNNKGFIDISGHFTANASGADTVFYITSTSYCSDTMRKVINISPKVDSGKIVGDTLVCAGSTITLYDSLASYRGTWFSKGVAQLDSLKDSLGFYNGISAIGDTIIYSVFRGLSAGTDTIIYKVSNLCKSSSATKIITVLPLPSISNITSLSICNDSLFKFVPQFNTLGTTFSWFRDTIVGITNPKASGIDTINEYIINDSLKPIVVIYHDTLTLGACKNVQQIAVTVNPLPVLSSPLNMPSICGGDTVFYVPQSTISGVTYTWFRDTVVGVTNSIGTGGDTIKEYLYSNGLKIDTVVYEIALHVNTCYNVQYVSLIIKPLPTLINDTNQGLQCGNPFQLIDSTVTPTTTYSWSRPSFIGLASPATHGTGNIVETLINATTQPIAMYYIDTLKAFGCINYQNIALTLNPAPVPPSIDVFPASVSNLCLNLENQKFGTNTAVPTGQQFTWTVANGYIVAISPNEQFCNVSFFNSGKAIVYLNAAYNEYGCFNADSVQIQVNGTPADILSVYYFEEHFVCSNGVESAYQWGYDNASDFSSKNIDNEIYQSYYNPYPDTFNNNYWVQTTTANGCKQKTYYNPPTTKVNEVNNSIGSISIYPNPASTILNIETTITGSYEIFIYNMLGQALQMQQISDKNGSMNIAKLPSGCYLLTGIKDGITTKPIRFIKN